MKEDVNKVVGQRIKQRRKELGLSQDELAKKIGYKTKGAISYFENGLRSPDFEVVQKIAEALNTDLKYFWVDQEPKKINWSKDLGKRLRELRGSISLNELESKININKAEITRFEKGDLSPSYNDLIKYAKYFEVDINYLLGLTDVKTTYSNSNNSSNNTEIDKINKILVNIENRYLKEILEILEILNKNKNFEKLINIKPLIK